MIRHERLNKPSNPCESSREYDFAECVEKSIITKVGCQPPWRRYTVEGVPLCDNMSLLMNYGAANLERMYLMDTIELVEDTKCVLPCSFMEYKVGCWTKIGM